MMNCCMHVTLSLYYLVRMTLTLSFTVHHIIMIFLIAITAANLLKMLLINELLFSLHGRTIYKAPRDPSTE